VTGGLERALETSGNLDSSGRGRPLRTCSARPVASVAPVGGAAAFDVGGIGRGGGEAPRTGRGDAEGVVGRWLPAVDLDGNPRLLAAPMDSASGRSTRIWVSRRSSTRRTPSTWPSRYT
jgi:hypothetical protein